MRRHSIQFCFPGELTTGDLLYVVAGTAIEVDRIRQKCEEQNGLNGKIEIPVLLPTHASVH